MNICVYSSPFPQSLRTLILLKLMKDLFLSPYKGKDLVGHPANNDGLNPVGRELEHSGVYLLRGSEIAASIRSRKASTEVLLQDKSMKTPNGLAFNARFSRLYVTDSVPAVVKVFEVNPDDGTLSNGRIFFNSSDTR